MTILALGAGEAVEHTLARLGDVCVYLGAMEVKIIMQKHTSQTLVTFLCKAVSR